MQQKNTIDVPGLGTITIQLGSNPGFSFEPETPTRIRVSSSDAATPIVLMCARMDVGHTASTDGEAPVLVSKDTAAQRARMLSEASGIGTPGLGEHVARYVDGKIVAIDRTGEWRAVFTAPAAMDAWATAHGVSWS